MINDQNQDFIDVREQTLPVEDVLLLCQGLINAGAQVNEIVFTTSVGEMYHETRIVFLDANKVINEVHTPESTSHEH